MLPEAVVLGTSSAETGDTSWNLTAIQGKDSEDVQWPGEETLCQSKLQLRSPPPGSPP